MSVLAAIDCGTNSTRLLVSEGGARPLERLMRITRLGQGVDATGRLAPDAIDRTVAVLREYREVMDRFGVERVRMTATSAARDAALPVEHRGPRPTGGVGGTRRGVKCLHAHYAWFLAGGDDPVGRWVHEQMTASA